MGETKLSMNENNSKPNTVGGTIEQMSLSDMDAFDFDSDNLPQDESLGLDFDSTWVISNSNVEWGSSHESVRPSSRRDNDATSSTQHHTTSELPADICDENSYISSMDLNESCQDDDDALLEWNEVLRHLTVDNDTAQAISESVPNPSSLSQTYEPNTTPDTDSNLSLYGDVFTETTPNPSTFKSKDVHVQMPRKVSDAAIIKTNAKLKKASQPAQHNGYKPKHVLSVGKNYDTKPYQSSTNQKCNVRGKGTCLPPPPSKSYPIVGSLVLDKEAYKTKSHLKAPLPPPPLSSGRYSSPVVVVANKRDVNNDAKNSKEARRRRIELMLSRQRGLYQRRLKERHNQLKETSNLTTSTFLNTDEAATSAAVVAALSVTPTTVPDEDVANIAFHLMHSVAQTNKKFSDDTLNKAKVSSSMAKNPADVASLVSSKQLPSKKNQTSVVPSVSTAMKSNATKPSGAKKMSIKPNATTTKSKSSVPQKKEKKKSGSITKSEDKKGSIHGVELPTGSDPESRRQRRLIRNRLSAQLHRERKREAMDSLQKEIQDRDDKISGLQKELRAAHTKATELESSLSILRDHFGVDVVNQVLKTNLPSKLNSPQLVSTSGSEFSDDETLSPPSSPGHEFSKNENSIESSGALNQNTLSNMKGNKRKRISPSSTTSKLSTKKKKNAKGASFLLSVATCAILGCIAIMNPTTIKQSTLSIYETKDNAPKVGPSVGVPSFSGTGKVDFASHHHDISRRLMSVPTVDIATQEIFAGNADSDIDCTACNEDKMDWVISPLEMYPARWEVDHNSPFSSPWTAETSYQLLDLALPYSDITNKKSSLVPLSSSSELLTSLPKKEEDDTPSSNTTNTRKLRGSKALDDDLSYADKKNTNEIISPISLSSQSSDGMSDFSSDGDVLDVGSSFAFCPDAHASLSPGLIHLLDFKNNLHDISKEAKIKKTVNHIKKGGKGVPFASKRMSNISNSNANSKIVQNMDNEFMSSTRSKILIENSKADLNPLDDGTDKALVPSQQTKYQNSFSILEQDERYMNSLYDKSNPYMTFLVPASILPLEDLDTFEDLDISSERPQWVELGCQIRSARLVTGVDFVGNMNMD